MFLRALRTRAQYSAESELFLKSVEEIRKEPPVITVVQ